MSHAKTHVIVLEGGFSSEREISLKTGAGVKEALRDQGYRVSSYDVHDPAMTGFSSEGVDVAFLALHGEFGEDGEVQAYLERIGLPYTGSGPEASRIAMDKVAAKLCFIREGLKVATHIHLEGPGELADKMDDILALGFPLVVKPVREGSSIGISLVEGPEELEKAVALAAGARGRNMILEAFIPGRELTVGILGETALPVIEICPRGSSGWFDFRAKYGGETDYKVPADIPVEIAESTRRVALRAHWSLGCENVSRVDMRLPMDETDPYLLEVNTIPGLTATSLLPKSAKCMGISYAELCSQLVQMSLEPYSVPVAV